MKLTSLKDIASKYYQLETDDLRGAVLRKNLDAYIADRLLTPCVSLALLENVQFFGRSFVLTDKDEVVFNCQSYQNHLQHNLQEAYEEFKLRDSSEVHIRERCLFLGGMNLEITPQGKSWELPGAANFGHFIFEYLQRLVVFDQLNLLDHLPIVVYSTLPHRYVDWLKLAGASDIITVDPNTSPIFRKVWVASSPNYRGTDGQFRVWAEGLYWLRQRLFKTACVWECPREPKRVYLGRQTAKWRRLVNEPEVMELLAKYDFTFPVMDSMTAEEQLKQVASAEVVVAAGGANTIMTLFAPTNATIISMFPHARMGTGPWGGWGHGAFLRQQHSRLDGVEVPGGEFQANSFGVNEKADFTIDVQVLERRILQAIKDHGACRQVETLKL